MLARYLLGAFAVLACSYPLQASASESRAVTLGEARIAPDYLRMLAPGKSVTKTRQCSRRPYADYWTELSAYRWNGAALPAQRWNGADPSWNWGKVTFDGITFTNGYSYPVLVAGWCS